MKRNVNSVRSKRIIESFLPSNSIISSLLRTCFYCDIPMETSSVDALSTGWVKKLRLSASKIGTKLTVTRK